MVGFSFPRDWSKNLREQEKCICACWGISREKWHSETMTPKERSTLHMRHHLPMGSPGGGGGGVTIMWLAFLSFWAKERESYLLLDGHKAPDSLTQYHLFSRNFQDFLAKLGLRKNPLSCIEQLLGFMAVQHVDSYCWATQPLPSKPIFSNSPL